MGNNKEKFKEWLKKQTHDDGKKYSNTTINAYINALDRIIPKKLKEESLFFTNDIKNLQYLYKQLTRGKLKEFNKNNNVLPSGAVKKYIEFLETLNSKGESMGDKNMENRSALNDNKFSLNYILYGPPWDESSPLTFPYGKPADISSNRKLHIRKLLPIYNCIKQFRLMLFCPHHLSIFIYIIRIRL